MKSRIKGRELLSPPAVSTVGLADTGVRSHSGSRSRTQASVKHRAKGLIQTLQMNIPLLSQRQALPPDPLPMHWKSTSKVPDIHDACVDLLSLQDGGPPRDHPSYGSAKAH